MWDFLANKCSNVETLTFIGEVWGLLSKDLPCSHLGERWQVELVAGRSVWQAEGELCHIRTESLQLGITHPGAIDYAHAHSRMTEKDRWVLSNHLKGPSDTAAECYAVNCELPHHSYFFLHFTKLPVITETLTKVKIFQSYFLVPLWPTLHTAVVHILYVPYFYNAVADYSRHFECIHLQCHFQIHG